MNKEVKAVIKKTFNYKKGNTTLDFTLTLGSQEVKDFIELLKQAVKDVEKEIAIK